jgi:penicillin-insensitive murein endopeptidase
MRRLAIGLMLLLLCGVAVAEEGAPAKAPAAKPTAAKPTEAKATDAKSTDTKAADAKAANAKSEAAKPGAKKPAPKGLPAKELFGAVTAPAPLAARSIGSYVKGCLSGGVSLPINGPDWQVMRLSRNRNWGNPRLLDYLERLASDARALDGWPGLLVGDMSQPRGGPMLTGHSSHQVGLDVDIWLTPMPDRILTPQEREDMSAVSMLKDPFTVDMTLWTPLHTKLIKRAASYPQVERIFVHPAIKKVLCDQAGKDRAWLGKVRPWWNHYYHFHVRLSCPPGSAGCEGQKPVLGDDGCGKELDTWFGMLRKAEIAAAKPAKPGAKPWVGKKPLLLGDLPAECKTVLTSGGYTPLTEGSPEQAALMATENKDAGPPPPHLDPAALQAMIGGSGSGAAGGGVPLPDRKPH